MLETREGRAEMRLERETGFRACLLGHIKEFEFYFKCHGKPFYGFEQEIDVIKFDLVFQLISLTSLQRNHRNTGEWAKKKIRRS